jgi:hypothetical protein
MMAPIGLVPSQPLWLNAIHVSHTLTFTTGGHRERLLGQSAHHLLKL